MTRCVCNVRVFVHTKGRCKVVQAIFLWVQFELNKTDFKMSPPTLKDDLSGMILWQVLLMLNRKVLPFRSSTLKQTVWPKCLVHSYTTTHCMKWTRLLGHAVNDESKSDNELYEEPTYVLDKTYRIGTYQIGSLAGYPVLNLITGRISDQISDRISVTKKRSDRYL